MQTAIRLLMYAKALEFQNPDLMKREFSHRLNYRITQRNASILALSFVKFLIEIQSTLQFTLLYNFL